MPREEIFKKFKAGTLKSGSGSKVTNKKQAVAIAMKYGAMKGLSELPKRK
jgi:hypothetical protein